MRDKKKLKILALSYGLAAVLALGFWGFSARYGLNGYRLAAKNSASLAFEETVSSVRDLSEVLEKSLYVTDSGMRSGVCAQAYASAMAAEAAMSTLPFSTYELERISGFLNMAGDYAYTLGLEPEESFTEEQSQTLSQLSDTATDFAESLEKLRSSLNGGDVSMDSLERKLENMSAQEGEKLSSRLLDYEADFSQIDELDYDGKYAAKEQKAQSLRLTEEEMLELAAQWAGVEKSQLQKEYEYQGESGRRCYRAGDLLLCLSPAGVESLSCDRLVSEIKISQEEAREIAQTFLDSHGYENLDYCEGIIRGAVASMSFSPRAGEAICLENRVKISIALDDGSVHSFDAADYAPVTEDMSWTLEQEEAESALPQSLKVQDCRQVIIKSAGGRSLGCYEFSCQARDGKQVKIYVDGETGQQRRIDIAPAQTVSAETQNASRTVFFQKF